MTRLLHALPVLCVAACVSGGGGASAPSSASSHYLTDEEMAAIPNVFPTTFVPPEHAAFQPMYERMVELQNPTVIGQLVSTLISLGDLRVPISVEECGEVDAHYVPSTQTIKICYEFVANANRLAGKPEAEWFTLDGNAAAVLAFTALHEMGHALIDVLDLPIRNNDEDAADEFAFLMLTNAGDAELVAKIMVAPAVFFHHHGVEQDAGGGPAADDVHSPSAQRAFEAVCLLYGRHRDPDLGRALEGQAPGCITHAAEVVDRWNNYLVAYTRLDNGRTFNAAP